ncbi:hypothetical protein ACTXT7_002995 [Hymenolepis weldensis]
MFYAEPNSQFVKAKFTELYPYHLRYCSALCCLSGVNSCTMRKMGLTKRPEGRDKIRVDPIGDMIDENVWTTEFTTGGKDVISCVFISTPLRQVPFSMYPFDMSLCVYLCLYLLQLM